MKSILILLFFISSGIQAQEEYNIKPNWKKGDVRYAASTAVSKVLVNGEMLQEATITANYSIRVVEVGEFYTVEYSQKSDQLDVDIAGEAQDSMELMIIQMIKSIEKVMNDFQFRVLVDKENGQAVELQNEDDFIDIVFEASESILEGLFEGEEMQMEVGANAMHEYLDASSTEMVQTVLNGINYLFQCYNYICVINESVSEEMMISDINALGAFGDTEIPAITTISSTKKGSVLNLGIDYDYDKSALVELIKVAYPGIENISEERIAIKEGQKVEFDMKSTWPNKFESWVTFDLSMPEQQTTVETIENTTIIFSKKP